MLPYKKYMLEKIAESYNFNNTNNTGQGQFSTSEQPLMVPPSPVPPPVSPPPVSSPRVPVQRGNTTPWQSFKRDFRRNVKNYWDPNNTTGKISRAAVQAPLFALGGAIGTAAGIGSGFTNFNPIDGLITAITNPDEFKGQSGLVRFGNIFMNNTKSNPWLTNKFYKPNEQVVQKLEQYYNYNPETDLT